MNKKYIFLSFFISFLLMIYSSCSSLLNENAPYLIANQKVELGKVENQYDFAGTSFTLYNSSEKDISSFTVSFLLYTSDGNNPFIGSNNIIATINDDIPAGSSKDVILSLDKYISIVPEEPFQIDFMYIRKLSYSDGSSWKDPFGMYSSREIVE